MSDFFHGWRRKTGCVLLLIATVFALGWARSYSFEDDIVMEDAGFIVSSALGEIFWSWKFRVEVRTAPVKWWTNPIAKINPDYFTDDYRTPERVPYWSIVVPLTLLSAYLILWMPRKREKKPKIKAIPCGA